MALILRNGGSQSPDRWLKEPRNNHIILEGALNQEMDEELGYSRYDYRNKETDNSRNGHSQKTMHTSYGDMEIDIPRDRKGEFEPQIVKKYQNTVGYTGALKAPVRCFGNHLSEKRESLFQTR